MALSPLCVCVESRPQPMVPAVRAASEGLCHHEDRPFLQAVPQIAKDDDEEESGA